MINLTNYDFDLPIDLIAKTPASPRECARLFVYDTETDQIFFDTFDNLDTYLPPKSLLVFNNTRVLPARLWLKKETGGKVESLILLNEPSEEAGIVKAIVDRKIEVGQKLFITDSLWFEIIRQQEQFFYFRPNFSLEKMSEILLEHGATPIPPYIKGSPLTEDKLRQEYQTVFAEAQGRQGASVAAPTASLHFSDKLMSKLGEKGFAKTFITLHVGLGTFAPVKEENFLTKKLHHEWYEVREDAELALRSARAEHRPIVALGTTACRTLESTLGEAGKGETDIFIFPPHHFQMTDALITNFHVPKSSLMLLVDAFLQDKGARRGIVDLYKIAIENNFRFYSFGDGMLIK